MPLAEAATLVSDFVSLAVLSEEAELTVSALLSVFSGADALISLLVTSLFQARVLQPVPQGSLKTCRKNCIPKAKYTP